MRPSSRSVVPLTLSWLLAAACHATAAVPQSAHPPEAIDPRQYCWWAVLGTSRSPDSVAAHFQKAYRELGFTNVSLAAAGDTAWSHAAAMQLPERRTRALYESNLVAYRHGDSTHFRYFVTISRPSEGWAAADDSTGTLDGAIDFCAEIARHTAMQWMAPRSPTGEESLEIWKSVR